MNLLCNYPVGARSSIINGTIDCTPNLSLKFCNRCDVVRVDSAELHRPMLNSLLRIQFGNVQAPILKSLIKKHASENNNILPSENIVHISNRFETYLGFSEKLQFYILSRQTSNIISDFVLETSIELKLQFTKNKK